MCRIIIMSSINSDYIQHISLQKIKDNIHLSNNPGMLMASPSIDPPYKYHWVRDASVVMRVFIDEYNKTKGDELLCILIQYINNEHKIQNVDTLTSLGEPKLNLDGSPFNGPWGRPQNDGPALRGINMIRLYHILKDVYSSIANNIILPIIIKDLNYIADNYNKVCFDLWEEIKGWHFYTRMVQLKFIQDCIHLTETHDVYLSDAHDFTQIRNNLIETIGHHFTADGVIISSFDEEGNIAKTDDAANLLAYSHIDYDPYIVTHFPVERALQTCNNLLAFFSNKYGMDSLNLIGRYANDKYYTGHIWPLCSLALAQIYIHISNEYREKLSIAEDIITKVVAIDINYDISEQYDPKTGLQLSAQKLTWNYAELYKTLVAYVNIHNV